ncbi:MAG: hypothetical protein GMKNLPBB_02978 [Myxococcota bacterium]|nr:hypothetical protein [Myxococcota bacterium]
MRPGPLPHSRLTAFIPPAPCPILPGILFSSFQRFTFQDSALNNGRFFLRPLSLAIWLSKIFRGIARDFFLRVRVRALIRMRALHSSRCVRHPFNRASASRSRWILFIALQPLDHTSTSRSRIFPPLHIAKWIPWTAIIFSSTNIAKHIPVRESGADKNPSGDPCTRRADAALRPSPACTRRAARS